MPQKRRGHNEGSIYKAKDGRWVAAITLENRKRKVFYGKTRKEVQEKLKQALHEQQQGTLVTASQQTLEKYLLQWLEDRRVSVRARTYERYEEYVRLHIVPVIGRVQLQKLTAQNVQALYTKKLKEGLSPTTVNTLHAMLHKALSDAVRLGLIARNVCDMVTAPRRAYHEITPLTIEQAQQLLAMVKGHKLEALFVLALTTGMRRGEVLALKWQDINFVQGTLQVRRMLSRVPTKLAKETGQHYIEAEPKTERSRRSIVLAPLALEALREHRKRQFLAMAEAGAEWQDNDLVFCTSLGTPLNPNHVLEKFKALLQQAGLPDMRFHDLRHSAATILLDTGVHPKVVQEMLGHNQISMTMDIYSHVLPTMQQDAAKKLNDVLDRGEGDRNEDKNIE
jgi:integrase